MAAKKRRRAKKQSGDRASRIAARILAKTQTANISHWFVATKDLKTLCASVLSQDETKGPRK